MKVCEQKSPVIQYIDLSPRSIYRHELRCTNSGAVSGFDCTFIRLKPMNSSYCISVVVTQHIKSDVLLELVTSGNVFRALHGHHQANKEY